MPNGTVVETSISDCTDARLSYLFRIAASVGRSTYLVGLTIDNATGIVDQLQLPRFETYMNYGNYIGIWTRKG